MIFRRGGGNLGAECPKKEWPTFCGEVQKVGRVFKKLDAESRACAPAFPGLFFGLALGRLCLVGAVRPFRVLVAG